MADFNYNTSITQGGFGGGVPGQIANLRYGAAPSVGNATFNAPVYQKARMNPMQQSGMQRHMNDQYRAGAWNQANDLERQYNPANAQLAMQQMQSANQMFNSLSDVFTQGQLGDRNNYMQGLQGNMRMIPQQMSFLGPLFSMFGG
jgi:hypothetical protein